jgi:hypothetical protein
MGDLLWFLLRTGGPRYFTRSASQRSVQRVPGGLSTNRRPEDAQSLVIHKVARALNPNGRFLFTSPKEIVKWRDAQTDRESFSLGAKLYHELLDAEGFDVVGERSG